MKRHILALFLGLPLLTGCGWLSSPALQPVSKSNVAAVEVTLTTAVRLANVCLGMTVGPCAPGTPLRAKIITDIHAADAAFLQVQADNDAGKSVTMTAINLAITELTAETPLVPALTPAAATAVTPAK